MRKVGGDHSERGQQEVKKNDVDTVVASLTPSLLLPVDHDGVNRVASERQSERREGTEADNVM